MKKMDKRTGRLPAQWRMLLGLCFGIAGCIGPAGCGKPKHEARLTIYPKLGVDEKLYLSKVPFEGKPMLLDSVVVKNNRDPVTFTFDNPMEEVYAITSSFNNYKISVISDTNALVVQADFFARTAVINSPATNSLLRFRKEQLPHAQLRDAAFYRQARVYADTVRSAAAFVLVYSDVDFGKDYQGLKKFLARASARFPSSPAVKAIAQHAQAFIKVMTEEYRLGDRLPVLTLPDRNGAAFNTAQLKGKLYLIDFWSTLSPACREYIKFKKQAFAHFTPRQLSMVSVALDPELGDWKNYLEKEHLAWTQLIDQKVWDGQAVKTIKFDSIPENYLVSPQGRILARSVPGDSLVLAIQRFLEKN